jgi:hypothetical protein
MSWKLIRASYIPAGRHRALGDDVLLIQPDKVKELVGQHSSLFSISDDQILNSMYQ